MIAELSQRLDEVRALCVKHHVRRLALFGSAAKADDRSKVGDLDFLVEFNAMRPARHADAFFSLQEDLERLFGLPVELVEPDSIRNPCLMGSVAASKIAVYDSA